MKTAKMLCACFCLVLLVGCAPKPDRLIGKWVSETTYTSLRSVEFRSDGKILVQRSPGQDIVFIGTYERIDDNRVAVDINFISRRINIVWSLTFDDGRLYLGNLSPVAKDGWYVPVQAE